MVRQESDLLPDLPVWFETTQAYKALLWPCENQGEWRPWLSRTISDHLIQRLEDTSQS